MWTQGTINYNGRAGYNEGRASKIWIERDGRTVFNYDRGMDIKAADRDTKAVLEMILKKFN